MKAIKLLICALVFCASVWAQTVNIAVPGETTLGATFSTDAATTVAAYLKAQTVCAANFTLASGATAADTTYAITGLIAQGCAVAGNGILIGSELSLITQASPLVIQRGRAGTTAATHPQGATVNITKYGSYAYFLKDLWAQAMITFSAQFPGPALTALIATQANAAAAIPTAQAALVQ